VAARAVINRPEAIAAEAGRVGEELRDARENLGASVDDMAERLRISRRHLHALEEGRIGDLPGTPYALGFVRSYAQALGLDAAAMTRRVRDGAPSARPGAELVFPEPVPERGVPAGVVVLIGALVAVGAYVAWWQWSGSGERTVDRVPPVPPAIEQSARLPPEPAPVLPPTLGQAVPVGPASSNTPAARTPAALGTAAPTAAVPNPTPAAPAAAPAAGTATGPTAMRPGVASPGAAPANGAAIAPGTPAGGAAAPGAAPGGTPVAPSPAATAAAPPPPPTTPTAPVPPGDGARIVLRAAADSGPEGAWVQVRDPRGGPAVLNRVLRPGESFSVPAREGLVLTTGRAQSLEVLVDGQPTAALGGRQGVVRDVALSPEQLRGPARP